MTDKFAEWKKYTKDVDEIVKQYFREASINPVVRNLYFSFSKKILAIVKKQQDKNLIGKFIEGNIQYFKTSFGGDEKIYRDIAKIVILAKVEGKKPEEILKEVLGVTAS